PPPLLEQGVECLFARAFVYRPDWLFLDEATSAVDEATEEAFYTLLQQRRPALTMISVAHRATVAKFHHRRLTLQPETRSIEDGVVSPARYFGRGTGCEG